MSADAEPLNASWGKGEPCINPKWDGPATRPAIVLSEEQANILAKVKKGDSVFITGPAGSCSHETCTVFVR
jgi:hypothetical protein